MKAIVQDRYGPPDVLGFRDVAEPVPAAGEVLLRVRAASLNAWDWHVMRGDPYLARLSMGPRRPRARVRGRDCAGTVQAVGQGVTRLRVGDEVYADLGPADGAFAELAVAPERLVAPKPAGLSFAQAAAVPLAGSTALTGLSGVTAGQRVLVNGASGGVGTYAVQIGVALGAEVTAVCSTRNVELARSLGAHHVVDYTQEDFATRDQRYDVLLDLVGNRSLRDLRRVLTPAGTLLLSGGGTSEGGSLFGPLGLILRARAVSPLVGQTLRDYGAEVGAEPLARLTALIEAGSVAPVLDRSYDLPDVPAALRYLETEHARAKVTVAVS